MYLVVVVYFYFVLRLSRFTILSCLENLDRRPSGTSSLSDRESSIESEATLTTGSTSSTLCITPETLQVFLEGVFSKFPLAATATPVASEQEAYLVK